MGKASNHETREKHEREFSRFSHVSWSIRYGIFFAFVLIVTGITMTPHRLERMFIYYPERPLNENPGDAGLAYQNLTLVTEDHVKLHGWFVPSEGARSTLLIFHGNAGNIGHRVSWIAQLHRLNVNVLIFDYRGFGNSEGEPFEEGLYRDARAAYEWWAGERQPRGDRLILIGESLGGAVAVNLAARISPAGLVLQSTFTSARDMAKTMMPLGLLLPLTGVRYDSEKQIARVACPKLVIHGVRDEIVPFRLGKALYEAAPPPKFFYSIPEAGHNDLLWEAGPEYSRRLQSFLSGLP
jgi:uncharacterized protein